MKGFVSPEPTTIPPTLPPTEPPTTQPPTTQPPTTQPPTTQPPTTQPPTTQPPTLPPTTLPPTPKPTPKPTLPPTPKPTLPPTVPPTPKPTNYVPWFIVGGVCILIGFIIIFGIVIKKNKQTSEKGEEAKPLIYPSLLNKHAQELVSLFMAASRRFDFSLRT